MNRLDSRGKMPADSQKNLLLKRLTEGQKRAVSSKKRRILVVAGAGSGKTEVMARRVAWWIAVEKVPKEKIVAFTRLIPLFPFNLLNYAFGLTKIKFFQYAVTTFVCMLPACIAFIVFSSSLLDLLK